MKRLETNRLILRDLKLSDLDHFYQYAKKENIGPMAGWHPHRSIEESEMILKNDDYRSRCLGYYVKRK